MWKWHNHSIEHENIILLIRVVFMLMIMIALSSAEILLDDLLRCMLYYYMFFYCHTMPNPFAHPWTIRNRSIFTFCTSTFHSKYLHFTPNSCNKHFNKILTQTDDVSSVKTSETYLEREKERESEKKSLVNLCE